ncbi:hypothetical protein KAW50_03465 [candidate division WOR-3 bacterium]|nr:hypothetical protein [candidate division WOR-3 bacterium]
MNSVKLNTFDLVTPGKELYEAVKKQTEALKIKKMDEQRVKELNLAVKAFNAYTRSFGLHISHVRLIQNLDFKKKFMKKKFKKHR